VVSAVDENEAEVSAAIFVFVVIALDRPFDAEFLLQLRPAKIGDS
jgi:hypothetical protein